MWLRLQVLVIWLLQVTSVMHKGKCPPVPDHDTFVLTPNNHSYNPIFKIGKDPTVETLEDFYPSLEESPLRFNFHYKDGYLLKSYTTSMCLWKAALSLNESDGTLGKIIWAHELKFSEIICTSEFWNTSILWNKTFSPLIVIWGCKETDALPPEHFYTAWVLLELGDYMTNFTLSTAESYAEMALKLLDPIKVDRKELTMCPTYQIDPYQRNPCPRRPCKSSAQEIFIYMGIFLAILTVVVLLIFGVIIFPKVRSFIKFKVWKLC